MSHPMSVNSRVWTAQVRGLIGSRDLSASDGCIEVDKAWSHLLTFSLTFFCWTIGEEKSTPHHHHFYYLISCLSWRLRAAATAALKIDSCYLKWQKGLRLCRVLRVCCSDNIEDLSSYCDMELNADGFLLLYSVRNVHSPTTDAYPACFALMLYYHSKGNICCSSLMSLP